MKKHLIASVALSLTFAASAQQKPATDWYLKNATDNKATAGIGANQAYTLVANRQAKPVIVAILDSGIDTTHEDLKGNLWVNTGEIPNNGIDDDNNGYIDDVHGWNFIGGPTGNIDEAPLELTRIIQNYNAKKKAGEKLTDAETAQYDKLLPIYEKEFKEAKSEYDQIMQFADFIAAAETTLGEALGKTDFTLEDLKQLKTTDPRTEAMRQAMIDLYKNGFSKQELKNYVDHINAQLRYNLNVDFNPRNIVGDDVNDKNDSIYGNNDLMGGDPSHGTHVAGIVGAIRNNGIGIDGIGGNVQIMVIRVVPNGDEYDKDVANAIRYAARNGAQVMNMSFGKGYEVHSDWVQEAMAFAESKGVIMVHAAGNDADDIDTTKHYPVHPYSKNNLDNPLWFEVGAHGNVMDKNFVADFSNYGIKTVDIFSPGVDIYSTMPGGNAYDYNSGTSMAAPVVTGAIAFILSYYPEIKAEDVKSILLDNGYNYGKKKVMRPNGGDGKDAKVRFKTISVKGKALNLEDTVKALNKMYPAGA